MSKITEVFEQVVERAWAEEKTFNKTVFKKTIKRSEPICQGLSRNIFHKIFGCFPNSTMLEFEVNEKSHIIVYVPCDTESYVIDGTIKQFLPKENGTVFPLWKYPFKKELQKSKRRLV